MSVQNSASPLACPCDLPISLVAMAARSSARSVKSSPTRRAIAARSSTDLARQSSKAVAAQVDVTRAPEAGTLRRYVPLDVTESMVRDTAEALTREFDGLAVHGIVGDFERHLGQIPPPEDGRPRVVAFLGGTIGNFPPGARRRFLRALARLLARGDYLLLGTDLVKDIDVLEAAYDDSQGVTAEFNRNVLHVLNRELDADFPTELFEHVAFFDTDNEWIEMRLRARRACRVRIGALDLEVDFARGEELRTEISAKFTRERVAADFEASGLELAEWITDDAGLFALSLAGLR